MFTEGHPIRIAVLDDDPALVRLVHKLLHYALGESVQVETFNSPDHFESWLENHCCDLLLSDIEMPEADGLSVLRMVKRRNAWTQVVMLTGASTSDRLIEALELGASDYLVKPVQTAALNEVVMQSVQRIRRWRRAFKATHVAH
ncbi:MAG: response regulator [Pirellulaceae bacterium]|nr:response regulator [Planctomycetales bacterium]